MSSIVDALYEFKYHPFEYGAYLVSFYTAVGESENNILLVEKKSKNEDYNIRLKKQMEKQKHYNHPIFKTPNIYKEFTHDGIFGFTMDYVQGSLLSEKFKTIELSELPIIANKFFYMFEKFSDFDKAGKEKIYNKIEELEASISFKNYFLDKSFILLKNFDWSYLIESSCHGDLTLENIILHNDDVYFIDFLDSFYDSWMIDCAKLLQDLECYWSYRKDIVSENTEIRLMIFKNLLISKIKNLKFGDEILETIYHLLLINLLRIIPYTNDKDTMNFLWRNIEKVIKIIEKE